MTTDVVGLSPGWLCCGCGQPGTAAGGVQLEMVLFWMREMVSDTVVYGREVMDPRSDLHCQLFFYCASVAGVHRVRD
jgi:hypothetical protein